MEGTPAIKDAVENNELVMACAYQGYVSEAVTAALPSHFQHRRYVAKFVNGELVELRDGLPEDVILEMLPTSVKPAEDCVREDCRDCEPGTRPAPVQPTN